MIDQAYERFVLLWVFSFKSQASWVDLFPLFSVTRRQLIFSLYSLVHNASMTTFLLINNNMLLFRLVSNVRLTFAPDD